MKINFIPMAIVVSALTAGCNSSSTELQENKVKKEGSFEVVADRFADLQVLRYEIPGFEELAPAQKELAYYLYEAALSGRDIIYDQKYKHNLLIRKTIEG